MTVDDFFNKYNGKLVDFDGFYGGQCMDLYQTFNELVVGAFHIPSDAHAVWDNYPINFYTKITNTPEGVPQKGDVVIWGKSSKLPFGHIAIFMEGNVNTFNSFDQNWPIGSKCHLQGHDYTGVIGWLRPNKLMEKPQKGEIVMNDQTKIDFGPSIGVIEVQAMRSMYLDARRDLTAAVSANARLAQTINELTVNIEDFETSNILMDKKIEDLENINEKLFKDLAECKKSTSSIASIPLKTLFRELVRRLWDDDKT